MSDDNKFLFFVISIIVAIICVSLWIAAILTTTQGKIFVITLGGLWILAIIYITFFDKSLENEEVILT